MNLVFLTSASLLFLGLNSIFCKVALVNNYIDAYSFTFFRLFFAAITLIALYLYKTKKLSFSYKTSWLSGFMLFLYAIAFSFSYLNIEAGSGTLLLFGVVQIVMLLSALFFKEKITIQKISGLIIAFIGLVYLLYPSESMQVSYFHASLMVVSGIAWAIYSVIGKSSKDALFNTMDNFIKASIFVIVFYFLFFFDDIILSVNGVLLAFISGSLTSAIGYVLWYKVLPQIQIITASILQLFVPIISIVISVIFLDELLSLNLIVATLLVSTGVLLSIFSKKDSNQNI